MSGKFRLHGLARRWMRNSTAALLCFVVLCVFALAVAVYGYYYASVRSGLEAKAKTASDFFTTYVSSSYAEYYQSAYTYAESFEDKDKLELQFVNLSGQVEISSFGFFAGSTPGSPDIDAALSTGEISVWSGRRASTGERIMAVSAPLLYSDGVTVGVLRYVTSLRLVDALICRYILASACVGMIFVIFIIFLNLLFIRSVTEPIVELTSVSRRIAEGSYGIQVENRHKDEIGDLIDSINEMSIKIGQSEKMQAEFISSVSHELRTPLTAITGWSETLAYDQAIQGDSRRGLEIISKEASRLTKMVEELLEFTRIQDGRFNLNLYEIDAVAVLEDCVFTYGKLLRQEGLEISYTPPDEKIPSMLGDPERLKQVFLNILDNASKYGLEGKQVDISVGFDGRYIHFRIRDYGPGIPENELEHVTKKFYKGSSRTRGSGIGLAVCEEIVTRHNGSLEIENAGDGRTGAVITVSLPVVSW